jgi:transcriptional regulator with XRE-family HTH domain
MLEKRDLGKAIQRLRGEKTQRACAENAGISASSWSLYEGGDRDPRPDMRARIAKGLGIELRILEETAWQIRNERITADEAGQKAAVMNGETASDPMQHAIDEHLNGVAHHLRELVLLLRPPHKPPLTP